MPIMVDNSSVWVDGVVLYRDDVVRLARLMSEGLPEAAATISVRYKGHTSAIRNVSLDDIDFGSVAVLDLANGRAVIDLDRGQLRFQIPSDYPKRKFVSDFYNTLERISPPSRIRYLVSKPNPHRVELHDLSRAQLRRQKSDPGKRVLYWAAVVSALAAVIAIPVAIMFR
ncbi:hypothetical protein KBX53_00745 [Micromonospora sp. M51]|uniref:hypothetical protein n=1 Tax=Micromonospora sp. M51 TaxID=2824889 RepID=UPI001B398B98|nr:hypothetical protein [Micromonospora sp. M51]MBQ1009507.1 hypothetical protein [Micromonospora sp. M51]